MLDTAEATLAEIDEAIYWVASELKVDCYGSRMSQYRRDMLQFGLDNLLDARLELMKENK